MHLKILQILSLSTKGRKSVCWNVRRMKFLKGRIVCFITGENGGSFYNDLVCIDLHTVTTWRNKHRLLQYSNTTIFFYILWTVHRDTNTWQRPTRCTLFLNNLFHLI